MGTVEMRRVSRRRRVGHEGMKADTSVRICAYAGICVHALTSQFGPLWIVLICGQCGRVATYAYGLITETTCMSVIRE
jgi:hypothetical protein